MFAKIKHLTIFIAIILIAAFLRFYNLGSIPTSLTIDEINNGYNAYSLLKTGRDEWGIKLPPYFKSTGDYDSPVLIYLTVPSVYLFGLSEFSTRLPVALFSLLSIPLVFLICRRYLFSKRSIYFSYAACFFYTTSQWHIFFSRSDFEAVIALFFVLINIYFLFKGIEKKNPLSFYLAIVFAYLSAMTYHSNKIFVPLINILFVVLNWQVILAVLKGEIKGNKLRLTLFSLIFAVLIFFFIKFYLIGPGAARSKMVFFTEDFDYKRALVERLNQFHLGILGLPMLILFWLKRFLEYFSPNFYIINGLGLTLTGHPGSGVLNLALYPLFLVGLVSLFVSKKTGQTQKNNLFLIGWLVLGFFPATLANNSQSPLRSLNASVPTILLSTVGLILMTDYFQQKSKQITTLFLGVFFIIFSLDFVRFLDMYTIHYPYELSEFRQYGWKELAIFAKDNHQKFDNVYVDPRFGSEGRNTYGVPYLYFLFYSKYDPQTYHEFPGRENFISDFENYHFTEIDLNGQEEIKENNLYIASPWSIPEEYKNDKHILYEVKFLNGKVGFYAVTNKSADEKILSK